MSTIDWDGEPRAVNTILRALFERIDLDPATFQPTAYSWAGPGVAGGGMIRAIAGTTLDTLLAGPPKGGKSTLAADLFRCRETGDQLFGRWWVAPGPTLLVTEETGVAVDYKTAGLQTLALIDRSAAGGHTFAEVLERLRQWAVDSGGGVIVIESGIQPRRPGRIGWSHRQIRGR